MWRWWLVTSLAGASGRQGQERAGRHGDHDGYRHGDSGDPLDVEAGRGPGPPHGPGAPHGQPAKPAVGERASEEELRAMQREIRDHLSRSELEVIVVLEGIDPHTSSTFQARHSYTAKEIVFDQMFVPSLSVGRDGRAVFDWNAFHEQQPVPFNRRHLIFGAHS